MGYWTAGVGESSHDCFLKWRHRGGYLTPSSEGGGKGGGARPEDGEGGGRGLGWWMGSAPSWRLGLVGVRRDTTSVVGRPTLSSLVRFGSYLLQ